MALLSSMFGRKNTIDSIKTKDLQKEQRKLDVQEQTLSVQIRNLEAQQGRHFKLAVGSNNSKADDRRAARTIHEFKSRQNDLESDALSVSQKLMALDRLIRMKERQRVLVDKGVWSRIGKMDLDSLNDILLATNIQDREQQQMVDIINETLGIDEASLASSEPHEIVSILEQIESARESGRVEEEFGLIDRDNVHTISDR